MRVKVTGAPGFVDEFEAELLRGGFRANEHVPPVSIVKVPASEIRVVPDECVEPADTPEAARYRAHWATLTGRSPADIYIPLALR